MLIDNKHDMELYQLLCLKQRLKLEIKGIKVSRGASAYSIIKDKFKIKGNKESILKQFEDILKEKYSAL
jgi:hypothetical protein